MKIIDIIIIGLLILSVSLTLRIMYLKINNNSNKKYNLENDGLVVIPKLLSIDNINKIKELIENKKYKKAKEIILKSNEIKKRIYDILGPDYDFHDYIFIIKKSQFHACHRDYNGDFFNSTQKYPSYTIIIYLENMDKCLDIIPKTHKHIMANAINITDFSESILCSIGDALLFNANLIHSGSLNKTELNTRIQMKISHKDDYNALNYFQQYNKILNTENKDPKWIKILQKHISCMVPSFSIITQQFDNNKYSNNTDNKNTDNIINKLLYNKYAKLNNI
jgi:ectoine hydroxylase-related dioxygenase (phytanoyl-CoA dioxygenase family)